MRYKLSVPETKLNELHSLLLGSGREDSPLEKITDALIERPLAQRALRKFSSEYKLIMEAIRFESRVMQGKKRKTGLLYSVHTDLVLWKGANYTVCKEGSHRLDLAFLLALKWHDLLEAVIERSGPSNKPNERYTAETQLRIDNSFDPLKKMFEEHLKQIGIILPEQLQNEVEEAWTLVRDLTHIGVRQFYTKVDRLAQNPMLLLAKFCDRSPNMIDLDITRELMTNGNLNLIISDTNLNGIRDEKGNMLQMGYSVLERYQQITKALYILHRGMDTISDMGKHAYLRNELREAYGGITLLGEERPTTSWRKLRSAEIQSLDMASGLFGATYIELLRCIRTMRSRYPHLTSRFDKTKSEALRYRGIDRVNEPTTESVFDGTIKRYFLHQISDGAFMRGKMERPIRLYGSLELSKNVMEKKLIDPTQERFITGLHGRTLDSWAQEYLGY